MGNDINASRTLVPLQRDRPIELGQYFDCPDMEKFSEIITSIIGNSMPIFAKNICFKFCNGIKLYTSYETTIIEDGSTLIRIPIVNVGDAFNIAYKCNF